MLDQLVCEYGWFIHAEGSVDFVLLYDFGSVVVDGDATVCASVG